MTLTSVRLSDSLQALIDSRLDTIERMLMGRVPRQDRLAIVKDVETQIFDLLSERGTEEPSRDDVLTALGRLDPPEAYLPEETEWSGVARDTSTRRHASMARTTAVQSIPAKVDSKLGKTSGILSLVMLFLAVLSPLVYLLAATVDNASIAYSLLFFWIGTVFYGSIVGFVLACLTRFRGNWAIVGGVLSPVLLVLSTCAAIYFLMLMR